MLTFLERLSDLITGRSRAYESPNPTPPVIVVLINTENLPLIVEHVDGRIVIRMEQGPSDRIVA